MPLKAESCECVDFEPDLDSFEDGDICVCGHTTEEHLDGAFRRCEFNRNK